MYSQSMFLASISKYDFFSKKFSIFRAQKISGKDFVMVLTIAIIGSRVCFVTLTTEISFSLS